MSFEDIHIGIPARFLREVKKYGQEELWILLHAFLVRAEGKTYLLKGEINEKFNVGVDRTEFALRKLAADGWFVEDGPGIWKMLNGQVEHQTQTELVQVVPATEEEKEALQILRAIVGFPKTDARTIEFLREMARVHPRIDLIPLLRGWAAYKKDAPFGKTGKPYAQLTNQFLVAEKWKKHLKADKPDDRKAKWKWPTPQN
jgi:hypothetical protein